MAGLVDPLAAEPELPVDRLDRRAQLKVGESRLLSNLTQRRGRRRFSFLKVPLGEPPVAIRIADEQVECAVPVAAEDDASRRDLLEEPPLTSHPTGAADDRTGGSSTGPSSARPSMNWRTMGSVVCLISSTVPT